jgi:parvulin-like peptidyl-prolyl isomerase
MATVLRILDQEITAEEIISLLSRYQILPQLIRELVIDRAIAELECSDEEITAIQQKLKQSDDALGEQIKRQSEEMMVRSLKIQKFKQEQWQHKLESYFLQRKNQLDQVIYSLIRTQDIGVADELYFRLQEGEQTFAELATVYSQGAEAQTGGLIGPVEIGSYHPSLANILASNKPGQLIPPIQLEEWIAIIRIEKYIPAQLDDAMCQRLLDELFENWLHSQLEQIFSELKEQN